MAEHETVSAAELALQKLADQLECSICLDSFTDPKLLQCFHVFCKKCLEPLTRRDQHGLSLRCPKCRRSTLLPANGVSGLQPAFHVHHLFEIQDALQKVKQGQEGQKTLCEKCGKREANGFCRDCNKFVCEACIEIHLIWKDIACHKVITLEQLKVEATEMLPPTKKILYCSKHPGNTLDLFCETDQELICRDCIIRTHRDHHYDLVSEAFPRHRDTITTHLEPVKLILSTVNKAIQDFGTSQDQIMNQRASIEADILRKIEQLHEALEVRKTELIGELDKMTQQKLKMLSIQRDELELVQTRLNSCLQFVNDSLKTGSEGEILSMKKPVVQQVKEMCEEFDSSKFSPQEQADMALTASSELLPACQQFGQVYISKICPEKCYATGKGLEVATVGEQSTATVHAVNTLGSACTTPFQLTCELVSYSSADGVKCEVDPSNDSSKYRIAYHTVRRGMFRLHIKISNKHIGGSPFIVQSREELGSHIIPITRLRDPFGVAINDSGDIIIAECGNCSISVYSLIGETVQSFGREGSTSGQFHGPCGIAVDRGGNILVVDNGNHRIQKFTASGKFLKAVGGKGDKSCQFYYPLGISISPSDRIYVCDASNHRVQILNPDLTYFTSFGSRGSGDGQFQHPCDVAFDSQGNVYVVDRGNHRIQVFTEDGHFLNTFGKKGGGEGELSRPVGITIDSDNVLYVAERDNHRVSLFDSEGDFLKLFATRGEGQARFESPHGIALDKEGLVYVTDRSSNCPRVHW